MLSLVPLCRYLDLNPDNPVVELLEPADLLVHVRAELVRRIAMSGLDDNIHVYLHRGVGVRKTRSGKNVPGVRYRPRTALRSRSRNEVGTHRTLISADPENPQPEILSLKSPWCASAIHRR